MKKYICFDIGGTKVKHGLLLENGSILSTDSYDTQCRNLEIFLKEIVDTINMYTKNNYVSGVVYQALLTLIQGTQNGVVP